MSKPDYIVLGAKGLIGSAVLERLRREGAVVLPVERSDYETTKGAHAGTLINCNGNSSRFRASQDPAWDFRASVESVSASLFDFHVDTYVYLSTVDVYPRVEDLNHTRESTAIDYQALIPYAFHKWLSERLVERYASRSIILRLGTVLGPQLKKNPIYDLLHKQPLFISPESELSFIDTETIAESVVQLLSKSAGREIFNVVSTGFSRLQEIATKLKVQPTLSAGAEKSLYRYNINNAKISELLKMPTSDQVVSRYLESVSALKSS